MARELGDRAAEAAHLACLGLVHRDLDDLSKAEELFQAALRIFEELESPYADQARRDLEELQGQE